MIIQSPLLGLGLVLAAQLPSPGLGLGLGGCTDGITCANVSANGLTFQCRLAAPAPGSTAHRGDVLMLHGFPEWSEMYVKCRSAAAPCGVTLLYLLSWTLFLLSGIDRTGIGRLNDRSNKGPPSPRYMGLMRSLAAEGFKSIACNQVRTLPTPPRPLDEMRSCSDHCWRHLCAPIA